MITACIGNRFCIVSDWEIVEFEVKEVSVKEVHEITKPENIIKLLTGQKR